MRSTAAALSPVFSSVTCHSHAGVDCARTSATWKRTCCHSPSTRRPCASTRTAAGLRGPSSGIDSITASLPAQVDVGRATLDLGSQEQVENDVAVVHAPDRAVRVHLHAEARRALHMARENLRRHRVPPCWTASGALSTAGSSLCQGRLSLHMAGAEAPAQWRSALFRTASVVPGTQGASGTSRERLRIGLNRCVGEGLQWSTRETAEDHVATICVP